MRLIDADELKKAFPNNTDWEYPVNTNERVCEIIDNAPTVEIPVARWDCYCEGQKVGYEKALSERPQGEWLENKDRLGFSYKCSNCGHEMIGRLQDLNYCCKCGADMRKGGAE